MRVAAALQPRPAAEGGEGGVARDGGVDRVPQVQVLALDLLDELAAQEGKVEEERHRGAARGGRVVVGGEGDPALVNGDEEVVPVPAVAVLIVLLQDFDQRLPVSLHV